MNTEAKNTNAVKPEQQEPREYVIVPEEAVRYLPEEWQKHLLALKEEGLGILATVDKNLENLKRLINAFPTMASLHYIQRRLASTNFEPTTEWMFENEMLTTAFVITYARLIEGGVGSGISRKTIPRELRFAHDRLLEFRNKRYAHNSEHDSITGRLEIGLETGKFDVGVRFEIGTHIGGAVEWKALVDFLNGWMHSQLHTQLKKLTEKTGREWTFQSGPPPNWESSDLS